MTETKSLEQPSSDEPPLHRLVREAAAVTDPGLWEAIRVQIRGLRREGARTDLRNSAGQTPLELALSLAPERPYYRALTNFISLGDHCATALGLNSAGLRQASYPFDWTVNYFELLGPGSLEILARVHELIETKDPVAVADRFVGDAFSGLPRSPDCPTGLSNPHKTNSRSHIIFAHDASLSESAAQEKYRRRFTRLYEHAIGQPNVFCLTTRRFQIPEPVFREFYHLICGLHPNNWLVFTSGVAHEYLPKGGALGSNGPEYLGSESYPRVVSRLIPYDPSGWYGFDYSGFRPGIQQFYETL